MRKLILYNFCKKKKKNRLNNMRCAENKKKKKRRIMNFECRIKSTSTKAFKIF